jgi:hypothetical protein
VIALEFVMFRRMPGTRVVASVMVVCFGIAIATVNDTQVCCLQAPVRQPVFRWATDR